MPIQQAPVVKEDTPTRWRAFVFAAKAWGLRFERAARNLGGDIRLLPLDAIHHDAEIIAESRSPLYPSVLPAEFALQAGKAQNLRVAARLLQGLLLPDGEVFSFWRQIPRPSARHGYATGRELREGCVVPSVGGGLCQLSNALYDAALKAHCEIVERHAHSRRLPGSMAASGRDATIFWNYVDLRFRPPGDCQLEVAIEGTDLVVRFRALGKRGAFSRVPKEGAQQPFLNGSVIAESCELCGVASCFRHAAAAALPQEAVTAWLVDGWIPEFDPFIAQQRTPKDALLAPFDSHRWGFGPYRWNSAGFATVHFAPLFVARRSVRSRRLAAQGAERQRALLEMDEELARIYTRLIPPTALHVVVQQNLLPFLWREGALAGRTFDVLMTRLPILALQARLDRAATRWPGARTLIDFRAPAEVATAETAALNAARNWITPHAGIVALAGERAIKLAWRRPAAAARERGRRFAFAGSTLARKGAFELRAAARELNLPITLAGPNLEGPDFWDGCDTLHANGHWLDDAAAVILPAWVEHNPHRLLEALAAGLPVITTPACGLDQSDGVTLVQEGDVAGLIEALDACRQRE